MSRQLGCLVEASGCSLCRSTATVLPASPLDDPTYRLLFVAQMVALANKELSTVASALSALHVAREAGVACLPLDFPGLRNDRLRGMAATA